MQRHGRSVVWTRREALMPRLFSDVAHLLDEAFPLHLVVGDDGRVRRAGPLAGRVLGVRVGARWTEALLLDDPKDVATEDLEGMAGRRLLLAVRRRPGLWVRAQCVRAGHGLWALLATPMVDTRDDLEAAGLTLEDLPHHDATSHLLEISDDHARSAQRMEHVVARLRRTSQALEARNQALVEAQKEISARNGELRREMAARERAETALKDRQKLETLGQLVGGITHDYNNLLVAIIGHASHGLEEATEPVAREALAGIYDAAERAAALTARLLTYSSPGGASDGPVDVSREARQVAGLLRRLLRDTIELDVRIEVQPAWVPLDRSGLEQILVNLAVNARDAMPDGGHLEVVVDHRRVDIAAAAAMGLPAGSYVCLVVRDDGCGMSAEVQRQVFEPFYTTKGPGLGTGLGLATVAGQVRSAGGSVQVSSAVGRGTTFSILLPEAEPPRAAGSVRRQLGRVPASEGSVILLVDDEPQIRRVVGRMLTKAGWEVRQAASSAEALERLPGVSDLALLITDQNMPGGTGVELVEAVQRRRPGVPCMVMSGYSEDPSLREGARAGTFRVLPKPFDTDRLLQAVERTIARTRLRRLGECEVEPPTMPSWIGRTAS